MGVVDGQGRPLPLANLEQRGDLRDVPFHRVHAVDDDHLAHARMGLELAFQAGQVSVVKAHRLPVGHLGAVDDGGVIELVEEHHVPPTHQPRDQAEVGVVPGGEDDAVFFAEEVRQSGFELDVEIERAVEEPATGAAGPVRPEGARRGFQDFRMVGQAEVVVRPQHDPLAALDDDDRVFGFRDRTEVGVESRGLHFIGPGKLATFLEERDVGLEGVARHVTSRQRK